MTRPIAEDQCRPFAPAEHTGRDHGLVDLNLDGNLVILCSGCREAAAARGMSVQVVEPGITPGYPYYNRRGERIDRC
jgi:hypothetical protein